MNNIFPNPNELKTIKKLNIDKIKDIEDVKRVLEFLNIEVTIDKYTQPNGFDKVKDLFEQ